MKNRFDEFTFEEMKFLDKAMITVAIEIGESACKPHLPLINEILDAYHKKLFNQPGMLTAPRQSV